MKKLTDGERIAKAAEEVLKDEIKYCKGRFNSSQIEYIKTLIPLKRRKKFDVF